jgi:hypothetical protein
MFGEQLAEGYRLYRDGMNLHSISPGDRGFEGAKLALFVVDVEGGGAALRGDADVLNHQTPGADLVGESLARGILARGIAVLERTGSASTAMTRKPLDK